MPTAHIIPDCPLSPAERGVVSGAWAKGALTDKEAGRKLNKGSETVRTQRESIANKANLHGPTDAGHLLIHLLDINWVRLLTLAVVTLLSAAQDTTPDLEFDAERARNGRITRNTRVRRTRREWTLEDALQGTLLLDRECFA